MLGHVLCQWSSGASREQNQGLYFFCCYLQLRNTSFRSDRGVTPNKFGPAAHLALVSDTATRKLTPIEASLGRYAYFFFVFGKRFVTLVHRV